MDGDGALDLVVGTEEGRLHLYRNTGAGGEEPFEAVPEALGNVNVGRNAAPAAFDVDGDGALDLVVGDFAGHLWSYLREGGARSLNFRLSDRRYLGVDVGVAATPFVGDIDRDGTPDMLIGSDQGNVHLLTRSTQGSQSPSGWTQGAGFLEGLKFPFGTSPRLADIDGDGDMDLLVGSDQGTVYLYRNEARGGPGAAP